MTKAWFRYERDFARRWCPVVIFDDAKPVAGRQDADRVSAAVVVPDDCLGAAGEPLFGRLRQRFPTPPEAEAE